VNRRARRLDAAAVAVPAILAAILGLIELSGRSLGFDEAASVAIATQGGGALGHAIARDGGNMSGYYVLLHVLISLFGSGTFVLRLPSVISITATVALVGLIGARLFDRRVAFAAGLLTAVSLPLVFWAQDARGYAPMVALVTGSFLAFVHLVGDAPRVPLFGTSGVRNSGRIGAWLAYFVCTTLAAYFGFVAVLVVPAQLLALLWRRRALPAVASALAASVLCWIPLAVLALNRGSGQLFWVPHPSLMVEKQILEALTSAGLQPSFHPAATMWVLIVVTVLIVGAVVAVHVGRALRPALPEERPELWGQALVILWLFVPVAVAFVESLITQPIFIARNLLVCLPAVALLLAVGLTDSRIPKLASCGALAGLIAVRAVSLVPTYGKSPENWRLASSYVLARAQPGDCAAFYPLDARMAFEYYVGQHRATIAAAPRSVLPAVGWGTVRSYAEVYATLSPARVSAVRARCPRLWLVSSHEGQPRGPSPQSRANWRRYLALRSALEHAYAHRRRTAFSYAATIHVELLTGATSRRRR
jgi:mannosyltransferase